MELRTLARRGMTAREPETFRSAIDTCVTTSWTNPPASTADCRGRLGLGRLDPMAVSMGARPRCDHRQHVWSPAGVAPSVRTVWMACSFLVLIYSVAVLTHVAAMGTIGVRCMFGTRVEEEIPDDYVWKNSRPHIGDWLLSIGPFEIHERNYGDYIRALRGLSDQIGSTVEVAWRDQNTEAVQTASVLVQRPPSWTYYRSLVWFLQEMLIFAIGARVFWKRPARRVGAVVLRGLHRHGRRIHGGLSLDGDRHRARG